MRQTFVPHVTLLLALTIAPCDIAAQVKAVSLDQVSEQVEDYIQKSRGWKHESIPPATPPGGQPSPDVSIHSWSSESV